MINYAFVISGEYVVPMVRYVQLSSGLSRGTGTRSRTSEDEKEKDGEFFNISSIPEI
jgi:hypothetical protein